MPTRDESAPPELTVIFRAPSRHPGEELLVTDELLHGQRVRALRFLHNLEASHLQGAVPLLRGHPAPHAGLVLPYHRAMLSATAACPLPPHRALLIGLGAGALAAALEQELPRGCAIDVVDIDAGVVYAAAAHFNFGSGSGGGGKGSRRGGRARVAVADGLAWLRARAQQQQGQLYDLVLLDTDGKPAGADPAAAGEVVLSSRGGSSGGGGLAAPGAEFSSDGGARALAAACTDDALCIINILRADARSGDAPSNTNSSASRAAAGAPTPATAVAGSRSGAAGRTEHATLFSGWQRHFGACVVAAFRTRDGAIENEILLLWKGGARRGMPLRQAALLSAVRCAFGHRADVMSLTDVALTPLACSG